MHRVYNVRARDTCFRPHAVIAVNYETYDAISTWFTRIYTQRTHILTLSTGKWVTGGAKVKYDISIICVVHIVLKQIDFFRDQRNFCPFFPIFFCGMPVEAHNINLWPTKDIDHFKEVTS